MFSKKYVATALSAALMLISCTPKVGESPPDVGQQKLEGTQCLSSLKPVITKFFKGTASDSEVGQAWDCTALSIKNFKKYVYGRAEDRYTSTELVGFIEKNFLDAGTKIPDDLRVQLMRFKQLFVGGSIDDVTRDELDKIVDMLTDLRGITLRLNPYMGIISQRWSISDSRDVQNDVRFFEKASDEIQGAAGDLAAMIVVNNQSYQLDDFVAFMKEYSDFIGDNWTVANEIEKYMPLVKKVKRAIAGGNENAVAPGEWKSFTLLGVRGYIQYLRYYYFIKSAADTGSGIRLGYLARSVEDLLGAFQDLVKGKPADPECGYQDLRNGTRQYLSCISKQEIFDMLQAFSQVWKEFHVSNKLVDEGMKLKKVYFGGSEDSLTSLDFERGKKKISNLKLVVEKFLPFYPIYSLEWDRSGFDNGSAQQFFKDAQNSLLTSATDLGTLFEDSYSIDSLVDLLTEVDRLYPSKDPDWKLADQVRKYIPLVKDVKNIVFSENDTLIKKSQWSPFLQVSSKFYSSYLYYRYFVEKESYGSSQFLEAFKRLTDQVLDTTKDIVMMKKNQIITADEVSVIANRLVEIGILPKGLNPQSIDQLVKMILNRVLWPAEVRLKGSTPNGITPLSLETARNELQIWYETEKYSYNIAATPLKPSELQSLLSKKLKDPNISESLKTGVQEMAFAASWAVAQTVDFEDRLVITNISKVTYNTKSLGKMNLNRALGRLLIRTAIESRARLDRYEGVNLPEAQALFKVVRPFFVEIGLLDPANMTFIENRFREANIFSAHGNGDDYVNFQEMHDIVGMIMSGLKINSMFKDDVIANCVTPGVEPKANTQVDLKCFRKVYVAHTKDYMTATPEYLKFFKNTSSDDWTDFFNNILKAAGYVPNSKNLIQLSDADLTPHVLQYVEMVISRFDTDKNGMITVTEAVKAYPSFKGILTELTKDQSVIKKKDLLALFTYILHYGKPPGGIGDFLFKWLPWKSDSSKWTVSADRMQLASILGYIADQVSKANKALISKEDEDAIRKDPRYKDVNHDGEDDGDGIDPMEVYSKGG